MATSNFPGFESPAASFAEPFEMLLACHARVQRSLALLLRLIGHIDAHGHDAHSQSAARDVLRYFEMAAPLHHTDEEAHVFPLFQDSPDAGLRQTVQSLQQEHQEMEQLWQTLREPLQRWSRPNTSETLLLSTRSCATAFCTLYQQHIQREESVVYPAAQALMSAAAQADMGRQMQARRQSDPAR